MELDDDLLKIDLNTSFLEGHEQRTLLSSSLLNSMAPAVQEQLHAIDTVGRRAATLSYEACFII